MPYRKNATIESLAWHPPQAGPELKLRIKVVTPMFGGGYEARNVDDIVPIRAAAIRGHLRFWWRATVGAQYEAVEKLFRAEAELWGSASKEGQPGGPGMVALEVTAVDTGKKVSASDLIPQPFPSTGPQEGVFLFPFQEQQKEQVPFADAREDVQFELRLSLQNEAGLDQVKAALTAWLLFGGVGARTRRGCGALRLERGLDTMPTDLESLKVWLAALPKPQRRPWPTLSYCVVGEATQKAADAWRKLGRFWSAVRKGHLGDMEYQPMSGGKWQDHMALRDLPSGATSVELSKPYLGLPIIYQKFPGAFDGQLEPGESGRYGSPVILKPLSFAKTVHPLVLVLFGEAPATIKIKGRPKAMALSVPNDEPLLRATKHPVIAVLKEAERYFGAAIRCGGAS